MISYSEKFSFLGGESGDIDKEDRSSDGGEARSGGVETYVLNNLQT